MEKTMLRQHRIKLVRKMHRQIFRLYYNLLTEIDFRVLCKKALDIFGKAVYNNNCRD